MELPAAAAALALLIAANSAPVLAARALKRRFSQPLDGGRVLGDGSPLLGAHKTWRGLVAGAAAAGLLGALMPLGVVRGAGFGLLALIGDALSSLVKRRLRLRPGADAPLLDQLPEALLPLLAYREALGLGAPGVIVTVLAFAALDALATRLLVR